MRSSPRVEGSKKNALTASLLKMKAMQAFERFETVHPMTQCHIPEDLHPQLQRNVICHFVTHNPVTAKPLLQFLQKWLLPPSTDRLANGHRIYFC